MAVPTEATYSVEALEAAHTALLGLIDAGSAAGMIRVRDSSDTLLVEITLTDPCGTVSGATGQLTLTAAAAATNAVATGTAAYGELDDSDGNVHLSLPAQAGASAVSGSLVLNTLSLGSGLPVSLISATIG